DHTPQSQSPLDCRQPYL
ncbi:Tetratricopeptide repeat-containing protein, partial [Gloeomargarita lithophora Alchichica-D10]